MTANTSVAKGETGHRTRSEGGSCPQSAAPAVRGCSGALDARHCSLPIRAFLRTTRFVEAAVQGVDLERRVVHLSSGGEAE